MLEKDLYWIQWLEAHGDLDGNKPRTEFKPIYIVFDPVKHYKQKINCHFPTKKLLVYRTLYSADKLGK